MKSATSFAQVLKQRRKALDLTQQALAVQVGCARVTIQRIEQGTLRPSHHIAQRLAAILAIPAYEHEHFTRLARGVPMPDVPRLLPIPQTPLIGRDEVVWAIQKHLLQSEVRLLTLTGPPGIGKTRLALQAAAEVLDTFANSVFFVALAAITNPMLVCATIIETLSLSDMGEPPLERLKAYLRDKQMLLVLDNFEQVLPAAPQIAELLMVCPRLKILATSRAPLRIRSERQFPVSPLSVPDLAHVLDMETTAKASAVTLFVERAQAVKADFTLTETNARTVAAICTRLDGLPLAIELISARIKLLPPAALLERLSGRLLLQSDGLRDLEPRHRTLNAAIEWSYQLLNEEEQVLFRRLGVFVGGWTLEAAAAICTENISMNILDGLASLLDKNLIKEDTRSDHEPRLMMLETIREYALEQLASSGEREALQRQHAQYFATWAENPDPKFEGMKEGVWWDLLEADHANLRAALAWGRTDTDAEIGLRLALALPTFWRARGHLSEARAWFADIVTHPQLENPPTRNLHFLQARAIAWLGGLCVFLGDLDSAQPLHEKALEMFRELEEPVFLADSFNDYGMYWEIRGDYERAGIFLQESLVIAHKIGKLSFIRWSLFFLSTLAYSQGDGRQAQALAEESLGMMRDGDDIWGISSVLAILAMIALDKGDYERAGAPLRESLSRMRDIDERWQAVHTLEVFARLAAVQAQHSPEALPLLLRSARIFGAAESLRETYSSPVLPFQRRSYDQGLTALRAQLDEGRRAAVWEEGRKLSLAQSIAYALDEVSSPSAAVFAERTDDIQGTSHQPADERLIDPLSSRELQVLHGIATGHSNADIAEQMVVEVSTVKKHITHLYNKLDVETRTQALARARELHLL